MPIWTILAVVLIVVLGTALVVSRGTAVRRARSLAVWSETELDYRSRNDRVPNLEHTLSAYAFHQRRLEAHPAQVIPSPQLVTGARALHPAGKGSTNFGAFQCEKRSSQRTSDRTIFLNYLPPERV
jgi:hypothetical protein